ncbi:MAG: DNA gyrase subunit A [Planctomycetaceae bacterium]|nr:DNA gyrase subunit A [Planctomycetaceae bacterium]
MRQSYLTYAMSVIISRALPDARDGLKPSQRRILVAMNDLRLGPASARTKCSKIVGDAMGNYHPHGDGAIYATLVHMAQDWRSRTTLIDKQGNFGSLAGLPPAAMRYTEARLGPAAADMLADLNSDTVDFVPTYNQEGREPVVLPSKFPNLLVNGSMGIAVGMATSIPPHNLAEVCDAAILLIDNPDSTIDDIIEVLPGPDFPTGGVICGRLGIRQGYMTGRSTLVVRARTHFEEERGTDVIVVTEIPYNETRDRVREKLEQLVRDDKITGISRVVDLTDRNTPSWQVRLHIYLKRDADRDVVLNQLWQHSPLQATLSVIMLALVGNRPVELPIKGLIQEFLRHRVTVIRRRTEYQLAEARKRKHTVEGLLIAQIDIDLIIRTIRQSPSRAEAKVRLQEIEVAAEMVARALGDDGFRVLQEEVGVQPTYRLSANQSEAIVAMQLGSLANLERESLQGEHQKLLADIAGFLYLLADEAHILAVVREDMLTLKERFGDKRRTEISEEEMGHYDKGDLIAEEPMVVTLSHRGYIKRTPLSVYQAQNRGGRGIAGAKNQDEDTIEHLFVASTHDWLLFFSDRGKVYWQKVYDLPLQARTSKGRALVNLLSLDEAEKVEICLAVREFPEDRFLIMATRKGTVKKTTLSSYGRPMKGGLIAIKLDEGDSLIDVKIVGPGDDLVLSTANGMAIRFSHDDARPMGRATRGVRGIRLSGDDVVVGCVVAQPDKALLTVCENGYGKRTLFGSPTVEGEEVEAAPADDTDDEAAPSASPPLVGVAGSADEPSEEPQDESGDDASSSGSGSARYRRQGRGGKGLRDIKTTARNGKVVDLAAVSDDDEVLMITAQGKIQRIRARDVSLIGRNTQGVRIIRLDEGDTLVSIERIPSEILAEETEAPATE